MRHSRIQRSQFLILCLLHDRIHEETARIALHLRIRQFGITNLDDDITELLSSRIPDFLCSQRSTDVAIIQIRHKVLAQAIDDMSNQILVLPFMLEPALSIAILAVLIIENHQLSGSNLNSFHLIYNILCLHTVGTDVLDSARSHFARDDTEVLCTMIAMFYCVCHHVIKHLTATAVQENKVGIFQILTLSSSQGFIIQHLDALDGRMNHRTLVIACKQEVTATTQNEQRLIGSSKPSHNLLRLFYR